MPPPNSGSHPNPGNTCLCFPVFHKFLYEFSSFLYQNDAKRGKHLKRIYLPAIEFGSPCLLIKIYKICQMWTHKKSKIFATLNFD